MEKLAASTVMAQECVCIVLALLGRKNCLLKNARMACIFLILVIYLKLILYNNSLFSHKIYVVYHEKMFNFFYREKKVLFLHGIKSDFTFFHD